MTLVYGTKNKAKLDAMCGYLKSLTNSGLSIIGLEEVRQGLLPEPEENGNSPLENARAKARFYYAKIKKPVFSVDSGLYFDGLTEEFQPGVHVRRVNGKRMKDDEMTVYYAGLAARFGGRITARYINAVCLVTGSGEFEHMGEDISSEPFFICDKPHERRVKGFPLDRLSVHIDSGLYYYDYDKLHIEKPFQKLEHGFCEFFIQALNLECVKID